MMSLTDHQQCKWTPQFAQPVATSSASLAGPGLNWFLLLKLVGRVKMSKHLCVVGCILGKQPGTYSIQNPPIHLLLSRLNNKMKSLWKATFQAKFCKKLNAPSILLPNPRALLDWVGWGHADGWIQVRSTWIMVQMPRIITNHQRISLWNRIRSRQGH